MDSHKDLDHLNIVTAGNTVRTFLRKLSVKLKLLIQKNSQYASKMDIIRILLIFTCQLFEFPC